MELLDQVKTILSARYYSNKTEKVYVKWIKDFIISHNKTHPLEMGTIEIHQYLNYLFDSKNVSSSTQNQALNSIIFSSVTEWEVVEGDGCCTEITNF